MFSEIIKNESIHDDQICYSFLFDAGLKSSQVVPEGLVYTEVQKTVVRGVEAVLRCRFYGDPLAVYWRKGLDPGDLSLMVAWNGGRVSGPRFDDGSCDVDENYSLIIKNVSTADAGRIYCTVFNNKGPPMTNYTDIVVLGRFFRRKSLKSFHNDCRPT